MTLYRVRLPVDVVVEINDDNLTPDERPAFHGDTPKSALNRAVWLLVKDDEDKRETCKKFGGRRFGFQTQKATVEIVPNSQAGKDDAPPEP